MLLLASLGACGTTGSSFSLGGRTADVAFTPAPAASGGTGGGDDVNGPGTGMTVAGSVTTPGGGGGGGGGAAPRASLSETVSSSPAGDGTLGRAVDTGGDLGGGLLYTAGNVLLTTGLADGLANTLMDQGSDLENSGVGSLPVVGGPAGTAIGVLDPLLSTAGKVGAFDQTVLGSDSSASTQAVGLQVLSGSGGPSGQLLTAGGLNTDNLLNVQAVNSGPGPIPTPVALSSLTSAGAAAVSGPAAVVAGLTSAIPVPNDLINASLGSSSVLGTPGSGIGLNILTTAPASGGMANVGLLSSGQAATASVSSAVTGPLTGALPGELAGGLATGGLTSLVGGLAEGLPGGLTDGLTGGLTGSLAGVLPGALPTTPPAAPPALPNLPAAPTAVLAPVVATVASVLPSGGGAGGELGGLGGLLGGLGR